MRRIAIPAATAVLAGVCHTALAADPLGIYVGGSVGAADLHLERSGNAPFYTPGPSSDGRHLSWKAMLGIRPIPIIGAEVEYIDFGSLRYSSSVQPVESGQLDSRAGAAFAMLYAPIPLPFLDVFGKLGIARLDTRDTGTITGLFCPVIAPSCGVIRDSRSENRPAYGAGVQFKFGAAALRAEYERFSATRGTPTDFASVGLTWTF